MLNNPIFLSQNPGTDENTQQARAIQGIDTRALEKQPYVSLGKNNLERQR
jgi:hypothetical protein